MRSKNTSLEIKGLSKWYEVYPSPRTRLKQLVFDLFAPALNVALNLVRCQPITKVFYRKFWALKDVNLKVHQGESLGILGVNGSGKSTLLQLICSVINPSEGSIAFNGRVSALLELGSGFNPELSGRKNIVLNGQILGLSYKEINQKFESIIEFADIGDFIDLPVKSYSSGMVMRLAFAVAVSVEPDLLVIDEALAVGDLGFQTKCYKRLNEMRAAGVTLLLVTHSPTILPQICERAILMDAGNILMDGVPSDVINAYNHLSTVGNENRTQLRAEIIKRNNRSKKDIDEVEIENSAKILRSNNFSLDANWMDGKICAYFDKSFADSIKPDVAHSKGVVIESAWIEDQSGKSVNVLPIGCLYVLNFYVKIHSQFEFLRFSWVLRAPTGLVIGGGSTHQPGFGVHVQAGKKILVRSKFQNLFMPGNYIIDLGVRGGVENNEFLHTVSSATHFNSIKLDGEYRNGMVDCLVENSFTLEDATSGSRVQLFPIS